MNRPEVVQFLAQHHWVASIEQLRELKVSKSALAHARRTGRVRSPVQGVVVVPGVELSLEGRALLAQLAAGGPAFVSGPTAGALHGLRSMPTSTIEITIRERRSFVAPPACRVVRTSWLVEERDVVTRDDGSGWRQRSGCCSGWPASSTSSGSSGRPRTCGTRASSTPEQAWEYLEEIRRSGVAAVKRMADWLDGRARDRPAQSGSSSTSSPSSDRAGFPSRRAAPLRLPSGEVIHLDLAWPASAARRTGHSWWHGGDLGQRRDQARDRVPAAPSAGTSCASTRTASPAGSRRPSRARRLYRARSQEVEAAERS
jgi:hypothetical protein